MHVEIYGYVHSNIWTPVFELLNESSLRWAKFLKICGKIDIYLFIVFPIKF